MSRLRRQGHSAGARSDFGQVGLERWEREWSEEDDYGRCTEPEELPRPDAADGWRTALARAGGGGSRVHPGAGAFQVKLACSAQVVSFETIWAAVYPYAHLISRSRDDEP